MSVIANSPIVTMPAPEATDASYFDLGAALSDLGAGRGGSLKRKSWGCSRITSSLAQRLLILVRISETMPSISQHGCKRGGWWWSSPIRWR